MSDADVRQRISELTAEFEREVAKIGAIIPMAGCRDPAFGPAASILAQAKVELAIYTGAMESVSALFQRAVDNEDDILAKQAATVMTALEDSLALARATLDELRSPVDDDNSTNGEAA